MPRPDPPLPLPNLEADWRAGNAYGGGYINDGRFHPGDPDRALLVTDIAAGGGIVVSWQDLTDELWRNAMNDTRELAAVDGNGSVYVSMSGGVFVLDAPEVPPAPG